MKIAVTHENGQVFQHFGHTREFKVYDVEDGKVRSARVVDTNGSGHGALAGVLNELNAGVLICGGIGGGARSALAYDPDVQCSHHGEHQHHGGQCGSHGCGEHSCGGQ